MLDAICDVHQCKSLAKPEMPHLWKITVIKSLSSLGYYCISVSVFSDYGAT